MNTPIPALDPVDVDRRTPPSRLMLRSLPLVLALLVALAPDLSARQGRPGSIGIFPLHRTSFDSGALTIISITNTNLSPTSGSTAVRFDYVNVTPNPTNPFVPLSCTINDRTRFLTPADTFSIVTNCDNPTGGGVTEGYVVVTAQDPTLFNTSWSFNHLVGSELVVNASGAALSMNMLPAVSLQPQGQITDVNGNGRADYDGIEYEGLPDGLILDVFIAKADSRLTLVDLASGVNELHTVMFSVWNDNEFPLSTTVVFNCWFDQPLQEISPIFSELFLAFNTPDDPNELALDCAEDVTIETGWAFIDSLGVFNILSQTIVNPDGVVVGAISSGPSSVVDGGRLLWRTKGVQDNGVFPPF